MLAMSFTPRHFFTNCIIILSFPPSPAVSATSGTVIGGASGAGSSTWGAAGVEFNLLDMMVVDSLSLERVMIQCETEQQRRL